MKLFVTRKYVLANSAKDAIKKERAQCVDDVWVHEDWFKIEIEQTMDNEKKKMGF